MNQSEKILIFRTCGMVLWVLKELIYHSRIDEVAKVKIIGKVNFLLKDVTDHTNHLRSN